MTDKNNQCSVQSLHWSKRPSPKMTSLGNLPPILTRRMLQTPSDQATQVESTTRPSAFSVHKALPSRSLHSPASRDAQVGDVCLRFAWNLRRLNATIWCIVNNKQFKNCIGKLPPANVWHPLHLRLQEQGGYLAVPQSQSNRPKR